MTTHFVALTRNRKLGPISATYRTQDTCPPTCPLMGNGCYAETGYGGDTLFRRTARYGTDDLHSVADRAIAETRYKGLLRFEVSGDVSGPDDPWIAESNRIATERPDLRLIRYTHTWRTIPSTAFAYPVNASCETTEEAEQALAAGYQAVIVAESADDPILGQRIAGRAVVRCPAETGRDGHTVTCADCRLCSSGAGARGVVAFVVHGARRRVAALAVARSR